VISKQLRLSSDPKRAPAERRRRPEYRWSTSILEWRDSASPGAEASYQPGRRPKASSASSARSYAQIRSCCASSAIYPRFHNAERSRLAVTSIDPTETRQFAPPLPLPVLLICGGPAADPSRIRGEITRMFGRAGKPRCPPHQRYGSWPLARLIVPSEGLLKTGGLTCFRILRDRSGFTGKTLARQR